MRFNNNFFGFLLMMLFLTGCGSCEDQGQITIVEGRVTNLMTGTPAVGASVVLWIRTEKAESFNDGPARFSTERITDSTGFYSLTFFNNSTNLHTIQVAANALFHCSDEESLNLGERHEFNFSVLPQDTLLELQFTQTDFENNPDSVVVSARFDGVCLHSDFFQSTQYILSTNLEVDSTLLVFAQPGIAASLSCGYFEDGIAVDFEEISVVTGTSLEIVEVEY